MRAGQTRLLARAVRLTLTLVCSAQVSACEQPRPLCSSARGSFAATYVLVSGSGPCAALKGELLGVDAYSAPRSARDRAPDYERMSIAIQPQSLTDRLAEALGRADPNPQDVPYALGAFASSAPVGDLCSVPLLNTARVRLPALPPDDACTSEAESSATDVSYAFRNVKVYVTPDAYGTQLSADLTYTEQGCEARYRVWAVYPAVSCAMPWTEPAPDAGDDALDGGPRAGLSDASPAEDARAPDAGGPADANATDARTADARADARVDAGTRDAGASPAGAGGDAACAAEQPIADPVADPSLCASMADPALGRPEGSGIHADFSVRCDPALLLCVPTKEPPSLR